VRVTERGTDINPCGQNDHLLPKIKDVAKLPGVQVRTKKAKVWRKGVGYVDGEKYSVTWKPNEQGKLTQAAGAFGEMMAPFSRAEDERQRRMQEQREREVLYSASGGREYVDPNLARQTANRNGWRSTPGGRMMVSGGAISGEWCPCCGRLTVWCDEGCV